MLDIAEQGQIDSSTTIEEWLERIGFSEYIENFRAEGFDFAALQYGLDQEDLKALRITKKGHQKKLIFEVQQLISPSILFLFFFFFKKKTFYYFSLFFILIVLFLFLFCCDLF